MTTKKRTNTHDEESGWRDLLDLCGEAGAQMQLRALFDLLFTLEEKSDLAKRCLIIRELIKEEKGQREIAEDLNVSISKITRGSNALKIIDKKLKGLLEAHFK